MQRWPFLTAMFLLLLFTLLAGACGESSSQACSSRSSRSASGDDSAVPPAAPSATARAVDRELSALTSAYEPVAARTNFITSAHTLYVDAVAARSGDATIADRMAALKNELGRTEVVLREARSLLVRRPVSGRSRPVQRLMLGAIDARARAAEALQLQLTLVDRSEPGVEQQATRFDAQWNTSVRLAREALTLVQDLRSAVDAAPEREDAIR